jgi:iron-sulfur cluster assembly protein
MIALTPAAAVHLHALLSAQAAAASNEAPPEKPVFSDDSDDSRQPTPDGLRILVEKGGCAGMQYAMRLDVFHEGDVISESGGARVYMDQTTAALLRGAELDYCDDLMGTGFRLQNPNAVRSCGCGTSFEPAAQATSEDSPREEQTAPLAR